MAGSHKVAVVIGVGPGTGAAVAKRFAKEGYKLALLARRKESLASVQAEIQQAGGQASAFPVDASKPEDIVGAFKSLTAELGHPEVLVYNSGPGGFSWPPPGILDSKVEDFQAALASGVTGALVASQQVLPKMLEAGKGTIIFTGATAALRGGKNFALLSVPKFALRSLGQSIAREFAPQGIHVAHVIIDGVIDTPRRKQFMPHISEDASISPDAIAEAYWQLHIQPRSCWTQELDVRPYVEKW